MLAVVVALVSLCAGLATAQSASSTQQPTFAMKIWLKERTAKPESKVVVDIDLTNTSNREIQFFVPLSGPFLYKLNVSTGDGSPAPLTPIGKAVASGRFTYKGRDGETRVIAGGSVTSARVAPGKVLHDTIILSDYVDLSQPDQYTIRLERTDPYTNLRVQSNATTLTITKQ
jgi:hypothetical protein